MKRAMRVALILIIAGAVICAAALAMGGFDMKHFGLNQKWQVTAYYPEETVTALDIRTVSANVVVRPARDGRVCVNAAESENVYYDKYVEDGTLHVVRHAETAQWWRNLGLLTLGREEMVEVLLPEGAYRALKAETVSGSIEVAQGFNFETAALESTSGGVECLSAAQDLTAASVSGSIDIENVKGARCDVSATSGEIRLADLDVETCSVSSVSGDITLEGLRAASADISTTSGDVRLNGANVGDWHIDATSGDITGSVANACAFNVRTASGEVQTPPSGTDGVLSAETVSGDVIISME